MDEETQAAPADTGTDTGDSNFSTGGDGTAAPEPTPEPTDAKPEAKPDTHTTTFSGEEKSWTLDELKSFASDDHRFNVKVGDTEEKMTRADLLRHASLSQGAMTRMHQAAEHRKATDARLDAFTTDPDAYAAAYAEKNPATFADMRSDYTHREWMALKVLSERAKLDEMKASDPDSYADAILKRRESDRSAMDARKAQAAEAQQRHAQAQEQRKALFASIPAEMQKVGLAANRTTQALVGRVISEMERAGMDLEPASIAAMARDYHTRDLRALVDALDADGLEGLLGDAATKKLREAAVKKLKAADKQAKGQQSNGAAPAKAKPSPKRGYDLRDI